MLKVCLILSLTSLSLETVTLSKNYQGLLCTGSEAIITCTTDTGVLRWYIDAESNVLINTNTDSNPLSLGEFTLVVQSINQQTIKSTASLNVTMKSLNGVSIECRDSLSSQHNAEKATINLAGIPEAPTNFKKISSTFSSVVLSWSEPVSLGGVAITGYNIEVTEPHGITCSTSQCCLGPSASTSTITNLDYNTDYTFSISASNCVGIGDTATLNVSIIGKDPDSPEDLDVCVIIKDDGRDLKIRASWQCPDIDETLVPPIIGYLIYAKPFFSNGDGHDSSILTDCRCLYSIDIQEIEASTLYSITVASNNSVGSNANELLIYSSANISTVVTKLSSRSVFITATLSWKACGGVSAIVQLKYSVQESSALPVFIQLLVTLPISTVYIPLTDLTPGTKYQYSVTLLSTTGLELGRDQEQTTFETSDDDIVIAQCTNGHITDMTHISHQSSVNVTAENVKASAVMENCSSMDATLYISMGSVGAVIAALFLALLIVILICVRALTAKKKHLLFSPTNPSIPPHISSYDISEIQIPASNLVCLNVNQSYGQCQEKGVEMKTDVDTQLYEEIKESHRLPLPDITKNPLYSDDSEKPPAADFDVKRCNESMSVDTEHGVLPYSVQNPSYGVKESTVFQ